MLSLISEHPSRDVALLLIYYLGGEQKNSEVAICPSHHDDSNSWVKGVILVCDSSRCQVFLIQLCIQKLVT